MNAIKIYPKKGKPYYFEKMIGKRAIKGTHSLKYATRLQANESREIVRDLCKWIDCSVVTYIDFDEQLLLAH